MRCLSNEEVEKVFEMLVRAGVASPDACGAEDAALPMAVAAVGALDGCILAALFAVAAGFPVTLSALAAGAAVMGALGWGAGRMQRAETARRDKRLLAEQLLLHFAQARQSAGREDGDMGELQGWVNGNREDVRRVVALVLNHV